ncbi:Plasmodium exported protein, unknown function [Plasmodium vivax]|uniref:Uncharacterized protein n=1 Tax=Plasmodium vivax TaxID=5855 RepID=A0A1G4H7X8_PLAVI|nr:Plasmodium exported protein, unknown function [Plasmodium vivax]
MKCPFFVNILTVPLLIWIYHHHNHRTYNGTVTESLGEKPIQNDLSPYFQCGRWLAEGKGNKGAKPAKAKTAVSTKESTSVKKNPPGKAKEVNKTPKKEEGETDKTMPIAVNNAPRPTTGKKEIKDLLNEIMTLKLEEQKLKLKLVGEEIKLNDMVERVTVKERIKLNTEKDHDKLYQVEEQFMINYRKYKIKLKGIQKKIKLKKKLLKYRTMSKIKNKPPQGKIFGSLTKEDLIELEIQKLDEQVEGLIQNGSLPPVGEVPLENEEIDDDKASKKGKSKGKAKKDNLTGKGGKPGKLDPNNKSKWGTGSGKWGSDKWGSGKWGSGKGGNVKRGSGKWGSDKWGSGKGGSGKWGSGKGGSGKWGSGKGGSGKRGKCKRRSCKRRSRKRGSWQRSGQSCCAEKCTQREKIEGKEDNTKKGKKKSKLG